MGSTRAHESPFERVCRASEASLGNASRGRLACRVNPPPRRAPAAVPSRKPQSPRRAPAGPPLSLITAVPSAFIASASSPQETSSILSLHKFRIALPQRCLAGPAQPEDIRVSADSTPRQSLRQPQDARRSPPHVRWHAPALAAARNPA